MSKVLKIGPYFDLFWVKANVLIFKSSCKLWRPSSYTSPSGVWPVQECPGYHRGQTVESSLLWWPLYRWNWSLAWEGAVHSLKITCVESFTSTSLVCPVVGVVVLLLLAPGGCRRRPLPGLAVSTGYHTGRPDHSENLAFINVTFLALSFLLFFLVFVSQMFWIIFFLSINYYNSFHDYCFTICNIF